MQRAGIRGADGGGDASRMDQVATAAIATKDGGAPLASDVRGRLEPALGADLGHVRVHANQDAAAASEGIGARAFTHGSDIFLGAGESAGDLRLMAHEATHVVQQGAAAPSVQSLAHVGESSDPAEREADEIADRVVSGGSAGPIAADAAGAIRRSEDPSLKGTKGDGKTEEVQAGEAFIKGDGDKDEISANDVKQGQIGDCWLMAGLMAIARSKPDYIRKMIKSAGAGKWTVTFHFPKFFGGFEEESVTVDAKVPVVAPGGNPLFAKVGDEKDGKKELWVLLIEKAYAKTQGKYANITGSESPSSHQSMEMITGKKDIKVDTDLTEGELLVTLATHLADGKAVTFGTIAKDHDKAPLADSHKPRVITNHTYVLDKVDKDAKTVDLLNPWGYDDLKGLGIDKVKKFVDVIRVNG